MPEMQSPRLPLGIIEKHMAYGSLTSGCAVEKPEPKAYNEGRVTALRISDWAATMLIGSSSTRLAVFKENPNPRF